MIKTTLFCCLALVLGAQTTTAQTVKLFQDSCHTYSYDGSTGELQGSTRCYLHYNAADLEDTSYYFNTYSGVTSYYRYTFTYNANDLLSNYLLVQGESATGPWANFLKEDYFYDTQDRNTQYVAHFGNSNGDWVPYFRETFWFDDVAPADSSLYELWNESASAWGNYRRYFNYYYPNAALFKSVEEEWKMPAANWAPLYQEIYTYRPDGKPMILETKRYFGSPSHQVLRDSFIYLPNGKLDTTYTVNTLLPAGTVNLLFKKYHYDPEGNLIEETTWIKNTQPGAVWRPSSRISYTPGDGVYSTDHAMEYAENYNSGTQMFTPLWSISRQYTPQTGGRVLYREEYRQNAGNSVIYTTALDSIWYRAETVNATTPQALPVLDCAFSNPVTENSVVICNAPDPNATIELRLMSSMGQLIVRARVMPGEAWHLPAQLTPGSYYLNVWQNGKNLGMKKMTKGNW